MTEPGPGRSLEDRIAALEATVSWLQTELGVLTERVGQATDAEQIIRRARHDGLGDPGSRRVAAPRS